MRKASAFSPGHITGFFQICDSADDPLFKGSRGAGFSISKGVTTTVTVKEASKNSFEIKINGDSSRPAPVSEYVLNHFLSKMHKQYKVTVDHRVDIPVGSGLGSSGAGALSLSLALNEALDLGLTRIEAAQIAHLAEVECRTGLGTVTAEFYGGLEVRVKAGAPGFGRVIKIPSKDYLAVFVCYSPLSTSKLLKNEAFRVRVNEIGGRMVDEIAKSPNPERFMGLSRVFTREVGIASDRVQKVLSEMSEYGYTFGMAMLGETVFTLIRENEVDDVVRLIRRFVPSKSALYVTDIDSEGARLL